MTGIIVPVLEKRIFEYSFLGSSAEQDVVIHDRFYAELSADLVLKKG